MNYRGLLLSGLLVAMAVSFGTGQRSQADSANWQPGQHPRLIFTAGDKPALLAKIAQPGTVAQQEWNDFLANNRANVGTHDVDYADGAVIYWLTGDATAGQAAIHHAEQFMAAYPNGLPAGPLNFDLNYYEYRDTLLTYDLAYDLLTPTQRATWLQYIAHQGSVCQAASPGSSTGNIHMTWLLCVYGSAILLDGENYSLQVTDEPVTRGQTANGGDAIQYPTDASNFRINTSPGQTGSVYQEDTDFTYSSVAGVCTRCINWAPTGAGTSEPAAGTTYYISYTFTPNIARWKSDSRAAFEYHLDHQWHDGFYSGGLNPYGNLVADLLPYFFKMFKNDLGIDYGQDPDVKRLVDMYTYLKLPAERYYDEPNFLTLNDSSWPNSAPGDAWQWPVGYNDSWHDHWHSFLRTFVDWATSEYANDPEGYGQRYAWLWTQAYRNASGQPSYTVATGGTEYTTTPDWREALWSNNTLLSPYLNTTAVPAVSWPQQRYFRGKEVVVDRTDNPGAPDPNATTVSMVAGNHSYFNEHDQGDSGSFTFSSLGRDWVMDPGYGFTALTDHNVVGIQGLSSGGYPALIPGYPFGGFTHFTATALTNQASVMSADLHNAWSTTVGSSPVQRANRYLMSIHDGQTPAYLIIGDDLQRADAATDTFHWYLHAAQFTNVTIDAPDHRAVLTANLSGQTMNVTTAWPVATDPTLAASGDGSMGNHIRLDDAVSSTADPYFLHLMTPGGDGAAAIISTAVAGGDLTQVNWPNNVADTILWKTGSATISGGGVTSDAQLTLVRTTNGTITGLAVLSGRSVSFNGQTLLAVSDGQAPVTVSAFGPTASLQATDASQLQLGLPFVTAATLEDGGVSVPVYNDGNNAFINTDLPLSEVRRGDGVRYQQPFTDGNLMNLVRFNIDKNPVDQFTAGPDGLALSATNYDWPSLSKRDSTVYRRSGIFPTVIPPLDHSDAVFNFRFRFADPSANTRDFHIYFRTTDINPTDWYTNQNYVRLDFNAANNGTPVNQITLGQRVNGAWTSIGDNETLTASLPAVNDTLTDGNWHAVSLKLLGDQATLLVDGQTLIDHQTLPTTIPTAPSSGYLQWRVVGSSVVDFKDLVVNAIDQSPPTVPTSAVLYIQPNGTGSVQAVFGHGTSTDLHSLTLYESASPIDAHTDPAALTTLVSTTQPTTTMALSGANRTAYHALAVQDTTGNRSLLVPVTVDTTPPAAVTNLQAR